MTMKPQDTHTEYRPARSRLAIHHATFGYESRTISRDLSVDIPDQGFTAVVGPNGCGKSTLLRALSRIIPLTQGEVTLDGADIQAAKPRALAREIGLLPQTSIAPDGIRVADLVARGRAPHQGMFHQWRPDDEEAVRQALAATKTAQLSHRFVSELSGGQRQRVWLAMLLAQSAPIMLLDEPTTFLDISHQYDLLELLTSLNRQGKTIVAVLHDLNQAARYASHVIVMKDGAVAAEGAPEDVITSGLLHDVFDLECLVQPDPVTGTPMVIPLEAERQQ